jgi:hypothetical protein
MVHAAFAAMIARTAARLISALIATKPTKAT